MAAYRRVYNSRHMQGNCQERGSAPEPYARQSSMRYHRGLVYRVRIRVLGGGRGGGSADGDINARESCRLHAAVLGHPHRRTGEDQPRCTLAHPLTGGPQPPVSSQVRRDTTNCLNSLLTIFI